MNDTEIRDLIALARRSELTEEDWFELLERRRNIVKEHLRDMTLKPIEDVRFFHDYFGGQSIRTRGPLNEFIPRFGPPRFTQETRALFPDDSNWAGVSTIEHHRTSESAAHEKTGGYSIAPETHRFWGLTRNNEWIGIQVHVEMTYEPYKRHDRFEQVARPKELKINEYPIKELCCFVKKPPRSLWLRLGEAMKQWAEHRKALYQTARHWTEQFAAENQIIAAAFPE